MANQLIESHIWSNGAIVNDGNPKPRFQGQRHFNG